MPRLHEKDKRYDERTPCRCSLNEAFLTGGLPAAELIPESAGLAAGSVVATATGAGAAAEAVAVHQDHWRC